MRETFKNANQNNEWLKFIEEGVDIPNAIKRKVRLDTRNQLRVKYPKMPIYPTRIIKTVSDKQQRGIKIQEV